LPITAVVTAAAVDGDVAAETRCAAAVDDGAAEDDQIVHGVSPS
jgi:hypothetical protein